MSTKQLLRTVRFRLLACLIILLTGMATLDCHATGQPAKRDGNAISATAARVVIVHLHDTLQPASVEQLRKSLADANQRRPDAILLDLSTPGGWADSAQRMATMIRQSPTPVIIYLREGGTQIGGEGLRLLVAAASAAMHPDTRLVPLTWLRRGTKSQRAERQSEREALIADLASDLTARGQNPQMLRDLLWSANDITPLEAQDAGLIQGIARREEAAVRSWQTATGARPMLEPANVRFVEVPMSVHDHVARALLNPDLTVLLLTLGGLLILLEINTPGTVVPGAAGLLLVLLSLYALWQMPLRWQGVLLLLLSMGLLFAETLFPRGSAYGVGAVVALTLGLRLLVRGPIPQLEVDWGTSLGAGLGFGGVTAGLVLLGVRARRAKVMTGADAMIGWLAVAQTPLAPAGEILVRGELWRAHLSAGNAFLAAGETVKVQSTDGITLEVAPMLATLHEVEQAG